MPIPNANRAVIEAAKLRDYLLATSHPVGRFKAAFFIGLGFHRDRWQELEEALRSQHLSLNAESVEESAYGRKFLIRGILEGPGGDSANVVRVWIIRAHEDSPRFVTAYPGVR